MFFVQMSGFPGSGKSTLAREIAKRTGAIVMDHDIVKTALLETTEDLTMDAKLSGEISYTIEWSLIDFFLSQGQKIIFDSPCLYNEMISKGTSLAKKHAIKYKYVECFLSDFNEINFRLKNRESKISQIKEAKSIEEFRYTIENSKKLANHRCVVVDTSKPLDSYIEEVINYLME